MFLSLQAIEKFNNIVNGRICQELIPLGEVLLPVGPEWNNFLSRLITV